MTTGAGQRSDEELIRGLRDGMTEAIRAKEAARFLTFFGGEPVTFVLAPPLQFKGDEGPGRRGIEEWFASFRGPIGYEVTHQHQSVPMYMDGSNRAAADLKP